MNAGTKRRGFTVLEVLVALALAAIIGGALREFLSQHRRFFSQVEASSLNDDVLRVAWAVLASDLREADPAAGDVVLLAPDSLLVRSPVGFGVACASDASTGRVALLEARGRLEPGADSLLVHGSGGWRVDRVLARDPAGASPACAYGVGTAAVLELEGGAADVGAGQPLRAFRTWTYHPTWLKGAPWLARSDGTDRQVLTGPLAAGGLRFRLLDASGAPTSDPDSVRRVEVVARSETPTLGGEAQTASITMALRGRTR